MNNRAPIVAGLSLLAVIAAAGWMRRPATNAAPGYGPAPYAYDVTSAAAQPLPYSNSAAGPSAYAATPAPAERVVVENRPRTVVARRYTSSRTTTAVYRKRSKKKSAMIIGGGAAAGAGIGALAGGGKGAAIGAISGGAAGLIYDRATHKKRVE